MNNASRSKIALVLSSLSALLLVGGFGAAGDGGSGPPAKPIDTRFLRELAITRNFMLGRPSRATPTPDGSAVLFLRSGPRSPRNALYEFDVKTGRTRRLLTPRQLLGGQEEELSAAEKARRERMRITARGFARFQLSPDGRQVLITLSGKLYTFDRTTREIRQLPVGKGTLLDPKFSPDGKRIGYVLDHDVYVLDLKSMRETRVTTGGTEDVSHGLAEFVAQEEMGRHTGFWWSPDSKSIVYEEADARKVENWAVPDPYRPGKPPLPQRYPRPGKNNVVVRLGIISVDGGPTTWIAWDRERYPYLATVKWDKGGPLTILVQNRRQREAVLLRVDQRTGETSRLLVENDDAWLNIDQAVPKWLEDGSGFLWTSERNGHWQLELRDRQGKLVRVLVPPDAGYIQSHGVRGFLSVDLARRQVYYRGSDVPTEAHAYRVSLDGGKPERLTRQPGLHSARFSKNHRIYVHTFSSLTTMPKSVVRTDAGEELGELPSVAESPPFQPRTELVQVGGSPGYYCSITRPRRFDRRRRYPVLVSVYAGPGVQIVTQSMARQLRDQWRADQGFIVVSIDGRGTPGRGRDWERAICGSFGTIPLDDQVAALKALGDKYPELDLERVGIVGWSFGGYMSALAVLRRPDVFKAAVAGAPVTDWGDYDTHYTERYLGLPQDNPEGYRDSSLLTYATELRRPLLLIHGTADDNVFFLHTLKLANALFRAGKEFELLPLPGFTHMVPDPTARERIEERTIRFFQRHLGFPTRPPGR